MGRSNLDHRRRDGHGYHRPRRTRPRRLRRRPRRRPLRRRPLRQRRRPSRPQPCPLGRPNLGGPPERHPRRRRSRPRHFRRRCRRTRPPGPLRRRRVRLRRHGAEGRGLARWDGQGFSVVGPQPADFVSIHALHVYDDGSGPALRGRRVRNHRRRAGPQRRPLERRKPGRPAPSRRSLRG